ncbi:rhamnogalacturonan acetylesterase [Chitinimonas sp. BJYL2]|uniref:rhamnogalacturonan acetylesterase n=1 Tax=Chitinimonas sp. BJYL2 TaxID=2976696 RepID=UPI0022B30294|nr:rhamnogalacturonan acetylesterase [Chitinimonas sp. BJYL2]
MPALEPAMRHDPRRRLHLQALLSACISPMLMAASADPAPAPPVIPSPFPLQFATMHPTLHLVGDSTMADKAPNPHNPERGWGQLFRPLMRNPAQLLNHAANGRSTKSFRDQGRWQHVLTQLASGDYVLIQFGHNDAKIDDPTRYADARTSYRDNLRRFVFDVRERGATPLLATPIMRRQFDDDGQLHDGHGAYPAVVREVARALDVPLLDLHRLSYLWLVSLGAEESIQRFVWISPGTNTLYPEGRRDNTHFNELGASELAAIAADEMRRLQWPAAAWLRDAVPTRPRLAQKPQGMVMP